jgi:hypothetical protein
MKQAYLFPRKNRLSARSKMKIFYLFTMIALFNSAAVPQTGGTFDLSHNVIAGGGSASTGGQFRIDGTVGQNIAGRVSGGGNYLLRGGFWAFEQPGPTAAMVSISGSVRQPNGAGVRSALVTLMSPDGTSRTVSTGNFGLFQFEDVEAGNTYVISVVSSRFSFDEPVRTISVFDEISDLTFTATTGSMTVFQTGLPQ